MKKLRDHRPSPAMIVAFAALFASVVGTATALPGSNRVDRNDIRPNAVQSSDIKKRAVTSGKIGINAVTTSKVRDNNLTGGDIDESTLGPVPEVSFLKRFSARIPFGGDVELVSNGPVSVRAICVLNNDVNGTNPADGVMIYARTTAPLSFLSGNDDRRGDADGSGLADNETLDPTDLINDSVMFDTVATGGAPDEQIVENDIDDGWVLGSDGSYIGVDGETTVLGLRTLGSDCVVMGNATVAKL
ncbi:MAG: hypothetical protein HZB14_09305 [Actinobacteria bacterium]|nr:hypothetical protein [Actinomycetota bacterium]